MRADQSTVHVQSFRLLTPLVSLSLRLVAPSPAPALFPVSFTFLVYGTLAYRQYVKLMARPSEPFTVLTPIAPVVPPTATAPTTATEAILADEQQQQQQ